MGRKPERYKEELAKPEPKVKEVTFTELGDAEQQTREGADYRTWSGKYTPERQKAADTTDADLNLHHKEVQALLDADGDGFRIPFFADWSRPPDNVPGIAVFVEKPRYIQIVFGWQYDIRIRDKTWETVRPPKIVIDLKRAIKAYHKGGGHKEMGMKFQRLHDIFKELGWII